MKISVVIPTRQPHVERLHRTLLALRTQTLPTVQWETVIVDNASVPPVELAPFMASAPPNIRLVREPRLGLTAARSGGFSEVRGEYVLLVDDDNVLAPDYLANVVRHFENDCSLGAIGGRSLPEFERTPDPWVTPFHGLLALRNPGDVALRADWRDQEPHHYPSCAPIGAGMAIRRTLALDYVKAISSDPRRRALDRTGSQLVSGGDNDLVMHVLEAGFSVGYEPDLSLLHLISAHRTTRSHLGALNRAIARSWVRVLSFHGIRPWQPVTPASVRIRQLRAWWRSRAWQNDAAWVTWQGICGTFEGQADLALTDEAAAATGRHVPHG